MTKKLMVNCPHCKKEFNYYTSKVRPFCTDRCKLIDMGQWLDESYSIAGRDNTVYIEDSEMLQTLIDETNENY
jgi:endogenous inhibitor of DNA gyrase (YacG/DUF329 family)